MSQKSVRVEFFSECKFKMVHISNGLSTTTAVDTSDEIEGVAKNRIVTFCEVDDVEMDSLEFDSIKLPSSTAPALTIVINLRVLPSILEQPLISFPDSRLRQRPRTASAWILATPACKQYQKSCCSPRVSSRSYWLGRINCRKSD